MQVKKFMLRVGAMITWLPAAPQWLDRMDMHLHGDS
ncbi:hypothetical protein IOBOPIKK_00038 [Klebsiella phage vB_KpnS_SCNJ1-C]|nr:hypothetical protein IOBOPIKK_00038 [Klebsiella phage vB_KpnS_SCNJ1-C]